MERDNLKNPKYKAVADLVRKEIDLVPTLG